MAGKRARGPTGRPVRVPRVDEPFLHFGSDETERLRALSQAWRQRLGGADHNEKRCQECGQKNDTHPCERSKKRHVDDPRPRPTCRSVCGNLLESPPLSRNPFAAARGSRGAAAARSGISRPRRRGKPPLIRRSRKSQLSPHCGQASPSERHWHRQRGARMTSTSSDYSALFMAVRDAHSAYVRLSAKGYGRPDQELARDPDYLLFHKSGMQLATLGGAAAIQETIGLLSQFEGANEGVARRELQRLWAGMGSWTTDAAPAWTGSSSTSH